MVVNLWEHVTATREGEEAASEEVGWLTATWEQSAASREGDWQGAEGALGPEWPWQQGWLPAGPLCSEALALG